jgi:hypothetical protein
MSVTDGAGSSIAKGFAYRVFNHVLVTTGPHTLLSRLTPRILLPWLCCVPTRCTPKSVLNPSSAYQRPSLRQKQLQQQQRPHALPLLLLQLLPAANQWLCLRLPLLPRLLPPLLLLLVRRLLLSRLPWEGWCGRAA